MLKKDEKRFSAYAVKHEDECCLSFYLIKNDVKSSYESFKIYKKRK